MRKLRASLLTAVALLIAALPACVSAPVASPSLPSSAPLVAFYGDSYTAGTGASDASKRWSTRICEMRGWREFNPSRNGLGFVANREFGSDLVQEIIEQNPDIVIVTMGLNDAYGFSSVTPEIRDSLRGQIRTDFDRLTTALPEARLIAVEPFWYTAERTESLEAVIGWVRDAAAEVDAEYIAGASRWIQGRDGEMAPDGLHPNDDGYEAMTERMDTALRDLGL